MPSRPTVSDARRCRLCARRWVPEDPYLCRVCRAAMQVSTLTVPQVVRLRAIDAAEPRLIHGYPRGARCAVYVTPTPVVRTAWRSGIGPVTLETVWNGC